MDIYSDTNILINCFNIILIFIEKGKFYSNNDGKENNKLN